MSQTHRLLFLVVLITLLSTIGPVAAEDDGKASSGGVQTRVEEYERLLKEVQSLEKSLSHLLNLARLASADGTFNPDILRREMELLAGEAEAFKVAVHGYDGFNRKVLEDKAKAVNYLARDLRIVFRDGLVLKSGLSDRPEARVVVDRMFDTTKATLAPSNDNCSDAFVIEVGTYAGSTSEATNSGEASCGSSLYTPDVWFRYVTGNERFVAVDTYGSDFDTVVSMHRACPGAISNQLECNDDRVGLQSGFEFESLRSGEEYLIRVSGAAGATGNYQLTIAPAGEMRGMVRRASDHDPLYIEVEAFDSQGLFRGRTETPYGMWTHSLIPGDYFVRTRSYGTYYNEIWDNHHCVSTPNGPCDPTIGDLITISSGEVFENIDFELDRRGSISGSVRDGVTLEPVERASVKLWSEDGSYVSSEFTYSSGQYRFSSVRPGNYYVAATSSRYEDELYNNIPCQGGPPEGCVATAGTPVSVQFNTTTEGIDFSLLPKGRITGTVRNNVTDSPMQSVRIDVWTQTGEFAKHGYSQSDGSFSVGGLDQGTYFVTAEPSGTLGQVFDHQDCVGECDPTSGAAILVPENGIVTDINFDLTPFGRITGVVTDSETGYLIHSVRIRIYDSSGNSVNSLNTDSSGTYLSYPLDDGSYFVKAYDSIYMDELYDDIDCTFECDPLSGTPVSATLGQLTDGIDFELVRNGKITGAVSRIVNGEPIDRVKLKLYDETGSYLKYAYTKSTGEYTFFWLDPGSYFVAIVDDEVESKLYDDIPCPGGPGEGCSVSSGTPVTVVPPANTSGIDFEVRASGAISGTVTTGDGQAAFGLVSAINSEGSVVSSWPFYTNYGGAYELTGLPTGDYTVVADADSHYEDQIFNEISCPGEYSSACDPTIGTPVTVGFDTTTENIDFELDRLGSISGVVSAAVDETPLQSFRVSLYDQREELIKSDDTNSSGVYVFEELFDGSYFVATEEISDFFIDEVFNDILCPNGPGEGCDLSSAAPVSTSGNQTVSGIDFVLDPGGSITGFVTSERTGTPLVRRSVELWDSAGQSVGRVVTDNSGYYAFHQLVSGNYFVSTDIGYTYLDELFDNLPCEGGAPAGCDPTNGKQISVQQGSVVRFINFAIAVRSVGISGAVVDSTSGYPVAGIAIDAWNDDGEMAKTVITNAQGNYYLNLTTGTYYLATDNPFGYDNEIYNDIPCSGGSAFGGQCDPTTGTPVTVVYSTTTENIDFELERLSSPAPICFSGSQMVTHIDIAQELGGSITGYISDEITCSTNATIPVELWDSEGQRVRRVVTNGSGYYAFLQLTSGIYYVTTDDSKYINELFDDLPCYGGVPSGCNPTKGMPITVLQNSAVRFVNFALQPRFSGISGTVIDGATGSPIEGAMVDVWKDDGEAVGMTLTDTQGKYILDIPSGVYFVSTDNPYGFENGIFRNIPCLDGPAFAGQCDPTTGEPVTVLRYRVTQQIDFALGVALFVDNFERGDLSRWSEHRP